MRRLSELNEYRRLDWELRTGGVRPPDVAGVFEVGFGGAYLRVVASAGMGWDHVSVSLTDRTPTWEEMEAVRKIFALSHEVWQQFGVPDRLHVNFHPYCLHWWREHHREVRLPPAKLVGPS